MMAVLCAGLSAGLGACAARDPYVATPATTTSGNWKIEKQTDRITGTPVPSAMLIINNASNTFADYAQPASMQLTCFDGKPMVRFAFEFRSAPIRTRRSVIALTRSRATTTSPRASCRNTGPW